MDSTLPPRRYLDDIEARAKQVRDIAEHIGMLERAGERPHVWEWREPLAGVAEDIPVLVAEVRRLRAAEDRHGIEREAAIEAIKSLGSELVAARTERDFWARAATERLAEAKRIVDERDDAREQAAANWTKVEELSAEVERARDEARLWMGLAKAEAALVEELKARRPVEAQALARSMQDRGIGRGDIYADVNDARAALRAAGIDPDAP